MKLYDPVKLFVYVGLSRTNESELHVESKKVNEGNGGVIFYG